MTDHSVQDTDGLDESGAPRYRTGIADGNLAQPIDLGDFMEGLGVVFQLPKRSKARVRAQAVVTTVETVARTRWFHVGMGVLMLMALGFWMRPRGRFDSLPEAARGVWVSEDPRYVGRGFDVDSAHIVFHTGGGAGELTRHDITGITVGNDSARRKVSITYALEGEPMAFAFWLENDASPTIRLVNQPEVAWIRR